MRRAGLQGVTGRAKYRRGPRPEATAADLVKHQFTRASCDHVTDITQHPTREGKVYCAVTVDAWLTPGGRLVHRRHSNRGPGHQRAKDPGCPPWVASAAAWLTP